MNLDKVGTEAIPVVDLERAERQFRSEVWLLLGRLLSEAPDAALLEWLAALEPDAASGPLEEGWKLLALAAKRMRPEEVADEYQALFVGLGRGEVVPYGSWYLTGCLMEQPLVVLREQLARLGLAREEGISEPEDHLGFLCQVMAVLLDPASGYEAGTGERFFRAHVQPFAAQCMSDLQQASSACFYAAVGRLGALFVAQEADRCRAEDESQ